MITAPRPALAQAATGVTLIVPVYNEAADLPDVLASILAQTHPHDAMYVLVVDGCSTDASVALARAWFASTGIAGRVVTNPRRRIPSSLNLGFAHARPGDIVVRLDAHTIYDPAYVATIVRAFADEPQRVACVGGPVFPAPTARFDHALVGTLHTNPMGLGGGQFRRSYATSRTVRSVYLGAWRPGVVESVGGFDETWDANEDGELAARLRAAGHTIREIPVRCVYRVKRGPLATIKQWAGYGYWRAQTLRRHPGELRPRHLVPPIALLLAAILLATPFRAVLIPLYALYALAIVLRRGPTEPFAVTLASCAFFPATQIAWTYGLIRGLLTAPAAQHRRTRKR
jgi:glycosyltransferase involved in cell wall biosynthesis